MIWNLIQYYIFPSALVAVVFLVVLRFALPRGVMTVFKRELKSFFQSPIAYVCVVIFLLVSGGLAFFFGNLIEFNEASLLVFFQWHPWIYMVIAPAIGMRLWSEEQRMGTVELIMTMPIAPWQVILGKFLAAMVVIFVALALTFPAVLTIDYLGEPDHGAVFAGYVGSFLLGVSFLGVTSAVSAFSRSQVVTLLISVALCMFLNLAGFDPVTGFLRNVFGESIAEGVASFGTMTHFTEFTKGIIVSRDLIFFLSVTVLSLFVTSAVLRAKRA
ncbi:MAG: ABC transporter permease subunit [Verrucomicrobiota bacterium]